MKGGKSMVFKSDHDVNTLKERWDDKRHGRHGIVPQQHHRHRQRASAPDLFPQIRQHRLPEKQTAFRT